MTPLERFLAQVEGAKPCEGGWRARCPAHDDRQPSLSISEGDDGRVLVNCHAGCSPESICAAVGLTIADLFPPMSTLSTSTKPQKLSGTGGFRRRRHVDGATNTFPTLGHAVAVAGQMVRGQVEGQWTYQDAAGDDVFAVTRFQTADGKTFRPERRVADGWQIGDPVGPLPLYRLPEIASAPRVYVTEGEKAAEAARSIGLVATTSAHGAKSPHKTDWSPLAGKDVVIFPDNDDAGSEYAETVAKLVTKLSPPARVRIVELPDLPEHGDVFDFLEQHDAAEPEALKETIEVLVNAAPANATPNALPHFPHREPFPLEVLPEPIRGFVSDGATAIGCDASYLALPLLSAIASVIGNTRRIELKRGWSEPAILWTACVGESGTLKTPGFKLVMRPLRELQAKALAEHESALANHDRAALEYDRSLAAWKRAKMPALPPVKPTPPEAQRFVVSDTTVEALAPILLANPRGLLMARDELAGWIGSFDRYAQGKGADSAHWLSMHNGETLIVDRKTGMPRTIYVPQAAVSVAGGIQPGILARALGIEHRESGLAARLLLSCPPRQVKQWTDTDVDPAMEAELSDLFERLMQLGGRVDEDNHFEPVLLPLSSSAKRAWVAFYNEHAQEQIELDGDLSAAWSKLEGYAARLTLVVHCVRAAVGGPELVSADEIDAKSIASGVALSRWFGNEARRIYAMLGESDDDHEDRVLREWIERRGGRVTVREFQQGNRDFATAEEARCALNRLAKAGYGTWDSVSRGNRGGRPSETFVLHRKAHGPRLVYETSLNAEFAEVS